jgi:ATP synthase subunit 6
MFSPLEQFDIIPLVFITINSYDFTFFNIFLPMLLIIFFFISINCFRSYFKLIPYTFQCILENIIEFIFFNIKNQIGKKGFFFLPFIFTVFTTIWLANLLSIIPFGIALTSHLIVTMWMSLSICLSIFLFGLLYKNLEFLLLFIPVCPIALLPVLILIEIFSYIIRAFSLSIRLTANILAGHTLVNIISAFILNTSMIYFLLPFLGLIGLFAILLLELGVACLQAYVLTILICIYLKDVLSDSFH